MKFGETMEKRKRSFPCGPMFQIKSMDYSFNAKTFDSSDSVSSSLVLKQEGMLLMLFFIIQGTKSSFIIKVCCYFDDIIFRPKKNELLFAFEHCHSESLHNQYSTNWEKIRRNSECPNTRYDCEGWCSV